MFTIEFVHNGRVIGRAGTERCLPAQGATITLEHAILGPQRYRVTAPPDHWYAPKIGRIFVADEYRGSSIKVYVDPIPDGGET